MDTRSIIKAYKKLYLSSASAESEYFRTLPSLVVCIDSASHAINSKGNKSKHQWRIRKITLSQAKGILIANIQAIKKVASFDELFVLIDCLLHSVKGIGELYIYDTSLRIGAYLGYLPKKVYLHAGTRIGAKKLGFANKVAIEMSELPDEYQKLEPFMVEDILCIFKDKLGTIKE